MNKGCAVSLSHCGRPRRGTRRDILRSGCSGGGSDWISGRRRRRLPVLARRNRNPHPFAGLLERIRALHKPLSGSSAGRRNKANGRGSPHDRRRNDGSPRLPDSRHRGRCHRARRTRAGRRDDLMRHRPRNQVTVLQGGLDVPENRAGRRPDLAGILHSVGHAEHAHCRQHRVSQPGLKHCVVPPMRRMPRRRRQEVIAAPRKGTDS